MPHQSTDLNFAGLTVPSPELRKAIKSISQKTKEVEKLGAAVAQNPTAASSLALSEAVCRWASTGQRVWGKLQVLHNPDDLGKRLCSWFQVANTTHDVGKAIECGTKIDGLGVSFASKHLRMLAPQRFAVLDSVLSEKLGFALNIAGYKLFMQMLHEFRRQYRLRDNVGTLELVIYLFIKEEKKGT